MSLQQGPASQSDQFHEFARFPKEIQLKIWQSAVSMVRKVVIGNVDHAAAVSFKFEKMPTIPTVFHITKDSRMIAKNDSISVDESGDISTDPLRKHFWFNIINDDFILKVGFSKPCPLPVFRSAERSTQHMRQIQGNHETGLIWDHIHEEHARAHKSRDDRLLSIIDHIVQPQAPTNATQTGTQVGLMGMWANFAPFANAPPPPPPANTSPLSQARIFARRIWGAQAARLPYRHGHVMNLPPMWGIQLPQPANPVQPPPGNLPRFLGELKSLGFSLDLSGHVEEFAGMDAQQFRIWARDAVTRLFAHEVKPVLDHYPDIKAFYYVVREHGISNKDWSPGMKRAHWSSVGMAAADGIMHMGQREFQLLENAMKFWLSMDGIDRGRLMPDFELCVQYNSNFWQ